MKIKLLLFLSTPIFCFAQQPITSYYSTDGANYTVLNSDTPINQSNSGANVTWDFNQLTAIGSSTDTRLTPTVDEIVSYPNTTSVSKNVATVQNVITTSLVYTKNVGNVVSVTAARGNNLDLNFKTDNATIGSFPMNYNYSFTDAVAGTYVYSTYSGTFSGTVTTSIDAYGTLTTNVDGVTESYPVTRFKSVQNIVINNGIFTNVGTINQTTYAYYNTAIGESPVFRTNTYSFIVPLLSINESNTQMEKYSAPLSVNKNYLTSQIAIYPNPVENVLNIKNSSSQNIKTISITDLSGRTILKTNYDGNEINVSSLQKGVYMVTITTSKEIIAQKIIKK